MDYCLNYCSEVIQNIYADDAIYNISSVCINLKESKERRKQFAAKAKAHGLDFKFFNAIDYRKIKPENYPSWVAVNGKRVDWPEPLTPGEVGCALSHQLLYELGMENPTLDALALFEDDALIQKPIKMDIPIDADLVMLSNRWFHNDQNEVVGMSCGTEAYIITRSGMYKMLQILQNLNMPLDLIMISHCQSMIEDEHGLTKVRNHLNPVLKIYHDEDFCYHNDDQESTVKTCNS